MGLRFYLLRHAKAEPHSLQKDDIDRALAESGVKDSLHLGEHLAAQQYFGLDHIWCSSAVRTRQTLERVKKGFEEQGGQFSVPVQYEKRLYHAPATTMLEVLRLTTPAAKQVMMVGHNPGISEFAAQLAKRGDAKSIHDVKLDYPTCALSIYEFHCQSWQEAGPANSEIKAFLVPDR